MNTKKVTVQGTEYTFQKIGLREYYKVMSMKDEKGNQDILGMYDYFFENVIVSPKVSFDSFDITDIDTVEELMTEVNRFLTTKDKK